MVQMQVGWDRGIFNPIHRTAHRLLTSFAQDCVCPRSHHFVVCYAISMLLTSNKKRIPDYADSNSSWRTRLSSITGIKILSKIPSFCCLHDFDTIDVKSETWDSTNIDYMTSNLEANAFDVSPAMVSHLTSYFIVTLRRTQTGMFSNSLG